MRRNQPGGGDAARGESESSEGSSQRPDLPQPWGLGDGVEISVFAPGAPLRRPKPVIFHRPGCQKSLTKNFPEVLPLLNSAEPEGLELSTPAASGQPTLPGSHLGVVEGPTDILGFSAGSRLHVTSPTVTQSCSQHQSLAPNSPAKTTGGFSQLRTSRCVI